GNLITVPAGYSVVSGFGSATLAPGASTTFAVQASAAQVGTYSGWLTFGTSDSANDLYQVNLSGTVSATVVQDDAGPGFAVAGTWRSASGQGYQGGAHYSNGSYGPGTASWTFTGLTPGQYRISATWSPYSNRATNAPYTIVDGMAVLG